MRIEILSFPAAVLATHPPGQIETRMTKRARLRVFPESSRSAVLRSRSAKRLKDQILRLALAAARRASRWLRISPAGSLSAAPRSRPQIGSKIRSFDSLSPRHAEPRAGSGFRLQAPSRLRLVHACKSAQLFIIRLPLDGVKHQSRVSPLWSHDVNIHPWLDSIS